MTFLSWRKPLFNWLTKEPFVVWMASECSGSMSRRRTSVIVIPASTNCRSIQICLVTHQVDHSRCSFCSGRPLQHGFFRNIVVFFSHRVSSDNTCLIPRKKLLTENIYGSMSKNLRAKIPPVYLLGERKDSGYWLMISSMVIVALIKPIYFNNLLELLSTLRYGLQGRLWVFSSSILLAAW